jgi:protein-disulfide isomerase
LVVHALNRALLALLWRAAPSTWAERLAPFRSAARYLLGRPVDDSAHARRGFLIYMAPLLGAVVLYQWVLVQKLGHPPAEMPPFRPSAALALYDREAPREIPVVAGNPRLGPDAAPARLTVFSDFQCPGCRELAGRLGGLRLRFGDNLQIVFKHYPLSTGCNDALTVDLHPGSCRAALAAVAAARQGRFWQFHDALFATDLATESPEDVARRLGLEMDRFRAELRSGAPRESVRADVALGSALGINETPALFLNGRRVHDVRTAALMFLVAMEIVRAKVPDQSR